MTLDNSAMPVMTVMLVAVIGMLVGCGDIGVIGTYQSVSESEWNLTVELKQNSIAIITQEDWLPGEYESRNIVVTQATWEKVQNTVLLKYNQTADTLIFDPHLSLSELGLEGGAPGLEQRADFSQYSLVRNIKLWRLPHDF